MDVIGRGFVGERRHKPDDVGDLMLVDCGRLAGDRPQEAGDVDTH